MDAFIVGIIIVVVTGVLVAFVRKGADKPRPSRRISSEGDIIDADIAGSSLHRTLADFAGEDPIDIDFGH